MYVKTVVAASIPFNNENSDLESLNLQDVVIELVAGGTTVKNSTGMMTIRAGYTRLHPNLTIPAGIDVAIEDGGEIQIT